VLFLIDYTTCGTYHISVLAILGNVYLLDCTDT